MAVAEALARAARARAQQRCQYCLMHEVLQAPPFTSSTSFPIEGRVFVVPGSKRPHFPGDVVSLKKPLAGTRQPLYRSFYMAVARRIAEAIPYDCAKCPHSV
jgi:hypothetical protein